MKNEPIILGIETALKNGSLSVLQGNNEIASYVGDANIGRSENLLPAINTILHDNNLILKDIKLLSVSTGPGSFTGIRAGIATAQALIMGLQCSYVGVSVLEALASYTDGAEPVIPVISAGRANQYVWKAFVKRLENDNHDPEMGTIDNLAEFINKSDFENLSIVVESSLFRDNDLLSEISNKVNNKKSKIISASDNVAKLIALQGYRNLKNNREKSQFLFPKYLLGVEIGNKRQHQ